MKNKIYTHKDLKDILTNEFWTLEQRGRIYDYVTANVDCEFTFEELNEIATR